MTLDTRFLLLLLLQCIRTASTTDGWELSFQEGYPDVPVYGPQVSTRVSSVRIASIYWQFLKPNAAYMVDNTHNYFHVAPDKGFWSCHLSFCAWKHSILGNFWLFTDLLLSGKQDGPTWPYSGSLDNYMSNLRANKVVHGGYRVNDIDAIGNFTHAQNTSHAHAKRQSETLYWLPNLAPMGNVSWQI